MLKQPPHPALITNAQSVERIFREHKAANPRAALVATSGGFDPLHVGHLKCIQGSALLKGPDGLLAVIVNDDGFLMRKKGYVFMPIEERLELIAGLRGVDVVVPWDDGSQFVTEAIKIMKPTIFAKGGDRSTAENVPEYGECVKIGCSVVFGIGGAEKIQSSSDLVRKYQK
jgi:D-beta-D-heptose 7-phosphate kinase/D-beta-D-heptose 1-phosphate adenosyltransferase